MRCNRTAVGFYVKDRWYPVLDDQDEADLAARDAFFTYLGGVHWNAPFPLLVLRLARVLAANPALGAQALKWLRRTLRRAGGAREALRALASKEVVPMTFVMHRFMHAKDVAPAWELLEQGRLSDDPRLLETQERLQACFYAMAHPESGRIVPACVQHAVLDPQENRELRQLLPLPRRPQGSPSSQAVP